ncbi:cytochrome P450 [Xylariaceae sp. FL1019]|nr:cytochrome P450 [Xylariaceae sp. FL1019]
MRGGIAVPTLIWAFILCGSYLFAFYLLAQRQHRWKARECGCENASEESNSLPFGIDNLLRTLAADKKQQFPVDIQKRFAEVGSYTHWYSMLGTRNIRTADPKNIQHILANQFEDWDLGPTRLGSFFPLLGRGIFTADGAHWKRSRALIRPQFTRDQVSDLRLQETHVQNLLKVLEISIGADGWINKIDMLPFFFRITMDSATEFIFGESVNSQLSILPGYQTNQIGGSETDFASAFDAAQMGVAMRMRFLEFYWLSSSREFRSTCRVVHEFVDHFVRLALIKRTRKGDTGSKEGSQEKYTFIDALAAETQDPLELRYELLHILLAGRDTTAAHLGWVFHSLARDPARFQKLRSIILEDFGTCDQPRGITYTRLKACRYLQQINDETLRLYPVVPWNFRYANKDTTLPRGGGKDGESPVFIPKGTTCDYSVYAMHRRKDLWGDDAEVFNPERWETTRARWEYLPFNGGPRICIGQQFALTEASYVIVRLLQRFDMIEALNKDETIRHNFGLNDSIGNGVNVRLHAAA